MPGYTDTELDLAVDRYIRTTISVKRDQLGPIDLQSAYQELRELMAATLIFDPNAIFYLAYLTSNRLNAVVEAALLSLNDLLDAIDELGRYTTKISGVSYLGEASSSLLAADTMLYDRQALSTTILTRYSQAVETFVQRSLAPNIRSSNQIVRTPPEAQAVLSTQLAALKANLDQIAATIELLQTIVDQYLELNLNLEAIQTTLRKARIDTEALYQQFNSTALTEQQKLQICRIAYLSLTASKSVLTNLSTISIPTDPRYSGPVRVELPFNSAVSPATVTSTKNDSQWEITPSAKTLVIAEDGNAPTTYTLEAPAQASLTNYLSGPFDIHGQTTAQVLGGTQNFVLTAPALNLRILVDGTERDMTFTDGTYTGAQLIALINAGLGTYLTASYDTQLRFTHNQAGPHSLVVLFPTDPATSAHTALGLTIGSSSTGKNANNKIQIDEKMPLITLTSGSRSRTQVAADINSWVTANFPGVYQAEDTGSRVKITKLTAGQQTLSLTTVPTDPLDIPIIQACLPTIGFYEGQSDSTNTLTAAEVAAAITAVGKITAEAVQVGGTFGYLRLTSKTTGMVPLSKLDIQDGTALATLGLTVGVTWGTTTGCNIDRDTEGLDIQVGDVLQKDTQQHTITGISGKSMTISTGLPVNTSEFPGVIWSASSLAYSALLSDLQTYLSGLEGLLLGENYQELDRLLNPLINNKSSTAADRTTAKYKFLDLQAVLSQLNTDLVAFVVNPIGRMDAILKMLLERGFNRAHDILLGGGLQQFFQMDKDDTTTSGHLLKTMRAIAREDIPASRYPEDEKRALIGPTNQGTDPDLDYSDADPDENITILGEAATFQDGTTTVGSGP